MNASGTSRQAGRRTCRLGLALAVLVGAACVPGGGGRGGDDDAGPGADGGMQPDGAVVEDGAVVDARTDDALMPDADLDALPDVAVPDAAPDVSERDSGWPDGGHLVDFRDARVDAALPDTALPDTALPDAAVPDAAAPDAAVPDASAPDAARPDAMVGDCAPDALRQQDCGLNGRGERRDRCRDGAWVDGECIDPDICVDGVSSARACGLNGRGRAERICVEGDWGAVGPCADPDVCVDDEVEGAPCGLNGRGARDRICVGGAWAAFGACVDADACVDGAFEVQPCDHGERRLRCDAGRWVEFTPCPVAPAPCGDGVCAPDEGCATCPADCVCGGEQRCDPVRNACICDPDCDERVCGDDGCGGSCGDCPPSAECVAGACEGGPGQPPRILILSTNVDRITVGESVIISAVVTDPDGIEDLIGGVLRHADGAVYGAFATSGQEGAYEIEVDWQALDRVETIVFDDALERRLIARFFDQAGNEVEGEVAVTLHCDGGPACGTGDCTDLDTHPLHCGACAAACPNMDRQAPCAGGVCGNPCLPTNLEAFCDGQCIEANTLFDCGGCGVICEGSSTEIPECNEGGARHVCARRPFTSLRPDRLLGEGLVMLPESRFAYTVIVDVPYPRRLRVLRPASDEAIGIYQRVNEHFHWVWLGWFGGSAAPPEAQQVDLPAGEYRIRAHRTRVEYTLEFTCVDDAGCADGAVCIDGACVDYTVGAPCARFEDCAAVGQQRLCVLALDEEGNDTGWVGGYCTVRCDDAPCQGDAVCVEFPGVDPLCFDGCARDADCRAGYMCEGVEGDGICLPADCQADADCAPDARCEDLRCVTDNHGTPCAADADCVAVDRPAACEPVTGTCVWVDCVIDPDAFTCGLGKHCVPAADNGLCLGGSCRDRNICVDLCADDDADCPETLACVEPVGMPTVRGICAGRR